MGKGRGSISILGIFVVVLLAGSAAWARSLTSPVIRGHLHNQTSFATDSLILEVTAQCVRRFDLQVKNNCGETTVRVPIQANGQYRIPAITVNLKKIRFFNRPRLKLKVDILFPDGQSLYKEDSFWGRRVSMSIDYAKSVLKEFTLFEVGGHDLTYRLQTQESLAEWLKTNDPDQQLHVLIRVLSPDLLPFTERVSGPVFAYSYFLKTDEHFMRSYFLAFRGDFTAEKIVDFEYFVTADGRFTSGDYYRFNDSVEMTRDLLVPFSEVTLKPEGCCHGDAQP